MSSEQPHIDPAPVALDPTTLDVNQDAAEPSSRFFRRRGRRDTGPESGPGLSPDGRLKSGRLAGLSMNRAIVVLSWPILAESILNSLVGLTDTVLASALSEDAADSIGAAAYVAWFVGLSIMAIGVGATALISRSVGRRRLAVANAAVGQTLLLQVVCGSIVAAIMVAAIPIASSMLNLHGERARGFSTYLIIIALGVPLQGILSGGIACLRGAGDSLRPLWAMVIVNVVNIVVSWSLAGADWMRLVTREDGTTARIVVLENPFGFNLGIAGVAWGTVIAEVVGAVIILTMLARGAGGVRLRLQRLKPHWHTSRRLVRLGIPNFLETLGMWLGNFMIVLMVGSLGPGVLGSHVVAIRLESFSFLPGFSMGIAGATLAGQYLGAGSPRLARIAVNRCTLIAVTLMGVMGVFFVLVPGHITRLFTSQPSHLDLVPKVLVIAGMVQIPFAISLVHRSALRGVGATKEAMWLTWTCTYAVRLPLAFLVSGADIAFATSETERFVLLHNPFGHEPTLQGLWLGMCLEILVRCVLFAWVWFKGDWAKARV